MTKSEASQIDLYAVPLKVRWGDMDSLGHVNNTCYFRYCEQVRMEWFGGLDLSADEDPNCQIVIINAFCEFLKPVRYPSHLIVDMLGSDPGNSSFMSHYRIRDRDQQDILYANGSAKVVWVDESSTRSVSMPASVRGLFDGL